MSQQSMTGFGVAHPVAYAPSNEEKKVEKQEEEKEYESLEEALLGE